MPQREAVRDDFDAPGVSEPDVASDPRAGVAAHTRHSMLKGQGRVASTPDVAQAVRWSLSASSCPRQLHLRGASGRGSRRRRSRRTRKRALGTETSSRVGVTLKTRAAKGPAWESSTQRARCGSEVRKVHLFFSTRLFTTAKKGLRRQLHGLRQQERARPGGRPLPGLVPACVGEDQLQQKSGIGALGSDGAEPRPARDCGSGSGGDGGGLVPGEQAQELHQPATDLTTPTTTRRQRRARASSGYV